MWKWLRNRQRKLRSQKPLPHFLSRLIKRPHLSTWLTDAARAKLINHARNMVAEKNWEGLSGLVVTEEMKWKIALQASRLTLGFDDSPFDSIQSILIYPSTYVAPQQTRLGHIVVESSSLRLGEAWKRGPIVLAWEDIQREWEGHEPFHNVVIHEFSHVLDMANGDADGMPVIENPALARDWISLIPQQFAQFVQRLHSGHSDIINSYGATNLAEFFAVSTEAFFSSPKLFNIWHPELAQLYQQYFGHTFYSTSWPLHPQYSLINPSQFTASQTSDYLSSHRYLNHELHLVG
ncbi:Protein MtfA [Planctopirus ephydatiae]|uniref:Protein MtfA n=1 Tax=Planctopirus ephydatiae TaxID=2528019 RepID=A0A518GP05_9PLAN|nr:M90 family metallopeptidase [Planctopirus ephydatiae]QDV30264.1 Protein MtfA [Planctopirus ephydatiae]